MNSSWQLDEEAGDVWERPMLGCIEIDAAVGTRFDIEEHRGWGVPGSNTHEAVDIVEQQLVGAAKGQDLIEDVVRRTRVVTVRLTS